MNLNSNAKIWHYNIHSKNINFNANQIYEILLIQKCDISNLQYIATQHYNIHKEAALAILSLHKL